MRSPRFRVSAKGIVKVAISTLISELTSHSLLRPSAPQPPCFLSPFLRLVSLLLLTPDAFLKPFPPPLLSFAASQLRGSVQLHSAMPYVSPSPPILPWVVLSVAAGPVVHFPNFFDVVCSVAPEPRPAPPIRLLPAAGVTCWSCSRHLAACEIDPLARLPEHRKTQGQTQARLPERRKTRRKTLARLPEHRKTKGKMRARLPAHRKTRSKTKARFPEHFKTRGQTQARLPEHCKT